MLFFSYRVSHDVDEIMKHGDTRAPVGLKNEIV